MNDLARKETTQLVAPVTPMELLQRAMESGADLDKLEKLMALQERWEASEARKAYTNAMAEFRSKAPNILKTRMAHNAKYAGLAETISQIKDLMSENGLAHSWKTEQHENLISVTCCVTHVQGHSECTSLSAEPDTSGSKNSIQAIGSTVSYLQRYTLYAILGLASTDQDTDANLPKELIDEDQLANLEALITETKANRAGFLKYLKIASLSDLPKASYSMAVKALEAKRK